MLKNHFATFYQAERTATEPPKGTYTFVAQCGLSGVDSRPAEPSRLPEPVAQAARRAVFADAVRRVQVARENREGRGRRQKMDRGAEFQDRIHLPQRAGAAQAARRWRRWRNISAPSTRTRSSSRSESHTVAGVPSRNLRSRGLQRLIRAANGSSRNISRCSSRRGLSQQFAHARPAIFQGQQDRHARRRRAPAISRPRNHAGFGKHQAHRRVHQRASEMHAAEIDRGARAVAQGRRSLPSNRKRRRAAPRRRRPKNRLEAGAKRPRCIRRADAGTDRDHRRFALAGASGARAGICRWPDGHGQKARCPGRRSRKRNLPRKNRRRKATPP